MLTKADIKTILSLHKSKEREEQKRFVCEGHKLVGDMLGAYPCETLIGTEASLRLINSQLGRLTLALKPKRIEVVEPKFDFKRLSSMTTPQSLIAVFELPQLGEYPSTPEGLSLLLDQVQDPGNVGTIIRTADWFGIEHIYLSPGCADPFSPKVLQATMGAMSRVKVHRLAETTDFLGAYQGEVLGAFLDGESIYSQSSDCPPSPQLLVVGNEGNGISELTSKYISKRITIPPYKAGQTGSESLNVAIATAICLSQLRQAQYEP